ncbi:PBSX family phage terminase large subunit [Paraburkholderia sp. BL9I2N2]|uniref:PBSX family phage terminase large subunit n=1 Tax=Paraburkholderia sp. BL9I2N2 TaxID=1938809 RepID=UPI00104710F8|nr:PBSX family phage terminase large subunit [Paraburkholderia sp. BL9I2N2]TCK87364.1 phage terminase large subunit [Paraburkholderia sp. BL9I2N2]
MSDVSLPDWAECLLTQGPRYTIFHGGRGSGKSMACATALVIRAASEPLRILCFREIQESIDESVKAIIEQRIKDCGLSSFFNITKRDITGANGSKFIFRGLSDQTADSIKSLNDIDIAWGEEAQALSKESLQLFLPTIRKITSEIWFSMNPELDTDYVYTAFIQKRPADARIVEVNWDRNPFWNAAMEAERLRSKADDPEDYDHIWEGIPKSALSGAIYRREMHMLTTENRIRPLVADPTLGLHAIFDLGINDMMAVTVAQADISGARLVGYHEDKNYGIDHYCEWLKDTGRKDATIWLPHDGNARSVQTGLTTKRIVENLGWQVEIVPQIGVEPGIKRTRDMLKNAFISDAPDCAVMLEHMRRYTRAKSGHPKHDEHSNCADSVRYTAVAMDQFKNVSERKRHQKQMAAQVRVIPTQNHWGSVNR